MSLSPAWAMWWLHWPCFKTEGPGPCWVYKPGSRMLWVPSSHPSMGAEGPEHPVLAKDGLILRTWECLVTSETTSGLGAGQPEEALGSQPDTSLPCFPHCKPRPLRSIHCWPLQCSAVCLALPHGCGRSLSDPKKGEPFKSFPAGWPGQGPPHPTHAAPTQRSTRDITCAANGSEDIRQA